MQQIDYPPVQQALQRIRDLSADAETRRLAFVRERALRDERSELRAAREEGWEEGREKGWEQGREEALAAMLTKLLSRRFGPLSTVTQDRLRKATAEQLEAWTDRILDAPDLEAVFRHQ